MQKQTSSRLFFCSYVILSKHSKTEKRGNRKALEKQTSSRLFLHLLILFLIQMHLLIRVFSCILFLHFLLDSNASFLDSLLEFKRWKSDSLFLILFFATWTTQDFASDLIFAQGARIFTYLLRGSREAVHV